MPVERISKGFVDISMTFKRNPLNNDLIPLKNETAISRSVRNLVMTANGEAPYDDSLGSEVSKILFNNMDSMTSDSLQSAIKRTIQNYEPRVSLIDVEVDEDFDNNTYGVKISYLIIGIDVPAQQLTFALQAQR